LTGLFRPFVSKIEKHSRPAGVIQYPIATDHCHNAIEAVIKTLLVIA
jgi:hypothetical protein